MNAPFIGRKSSSKSGGSASEATNTLRSNARARIVELLGEGEIVGLIDGPKSIFLDRTPLMSSTGAWNFNGVVYDFRSGLPDQEHMPGAAQVQTPYSVEVQVRADSPPPVRTIVDANADAVRVIMRIPALVKQNSKDGSLQPNSVAYAIDVRPYGGDWSTAVTQAIENQKCTSPYEKAHYVRLPNGGFPWDIRVRRLSADSTTTDNQNETWWASYYTVVEGKYTYPNSALLYLEVNAENFGQQLPSRIYHLRGLKIRVPSNYDPETRTYTGIWDGTFKIAWTNNPAWVLYDILVNDRYGLGEFINAALVDKVGLYRIAQYCDELIPSGYKDVNGNDVLEPRFTFNAVINTRQEAYKLIQDITNVFRGMCYWSLGQIFVTADMPEDPFKLVAPANVINGEFNYSGTAMKARHSVAIVTFNDPNNFGAETPELVIDDEMLQKYGWREVEVKLLGCTSRGLAHRYGRWILDTERYSTETVDYQASWDHAEIKPGNIVSVADPRKAAARIGGRIKSVDSSTQITLDKAFAPTAGETYYLMTELPSEDSNGSKVEVRQILSFADAQVTIASAFSGTPQPNGMWVITGTDIVPRQYRILSIEETDEHLFKLNGLFHDPSKFARIERDLTLDPLPYTRPTNTISPPTNMTAVESQYIRDGVTRSQITVSWSPPAEFLVKSYRLEAETPDGLEVFSDIINTSLSLKETEAGQYRFRVYATSVTGRVSLPAELTFEASGWLGTELPFVTALKLSGQGSATVFQGQDAAFTWTNNLPITAASYAESVTSDASVSLYANNRVKIYDASDNTLLREEFVVGTSYTYTFEKNYVDTLNLGRPRARHLRIEVSVCDTLGREGQAEQLTVSNPVPAMVVPTVRPSFDGAIVSIAKPGDTDFAGMIVWASPTSGFDPLTTASKYDGPSTSVTLPLDAGTIYYVRVAAYDNFGRTGLNISPEQQASASANIDLDAIAGELVDQLDVVRGSIEEIRKTLLAEAVARAGDRERATTLMSDVRGVAAAIGQSAAVAVNELRAYADDHFATASDLTELQATVGDMLAGIQVQWVATTTATGALATFKLVLKATDGTLLAEGGMEISALVSGGVQVTQTTFDANRFYIRSGANEVAPFSIVDGVTFIDTLQVRGTLKIGSTTAGAYPGKIEIWDNT